VPFLVNQITQGIERGLGLTIFVQQAGTGHGLSLWFETNLLNGVGFSTGPGEPETVYGSLFLPWTEPVELVPGDAIELSLQAKAIGADYSWQWNTRVRGETAKGALKAGFRQSTFHGAPLSLQRLRQYSADYAGQLNAEGELVLQVLAALERGTRLGDLSRELAAQYPERFDDWRSALSYLGKLAGRYTEPPTPPQDQE